MQKSDFTKKLIAQAKLPSLPHVLMSIYRELESDTSGIDSIVKLLETDAGLVTRTLQLGNSAYFGGIRTFSQVADVILRIGPFDLWALLMATEVKSLFFAIDVELMDMELFWRHSVFVACASRKIAEHSRKGGAADLLIAGLLHDIGKLLFLQQMPIDYKAVINSNQVGSLCCRIEEELLGINHTHLGAELCLSWNLPEELIGLIRNHHSETAKEHCDQLIILNQADELAHQYLDKLEKATSLEWVDESVIQSTVALYEHLCEMVF